MGSLVSVESVESVASGSTQGPDSEEGAGEASEPVEDGWSVETASERALPDLPPHLAFDGAPASLLFQPPWRQEERKHLTVRNITDGPLKVSVRKGQANESPYDRIMDAVEVKPQGPLSLEPSQSFQLSVLRKASEELSDAVDELRYERADQEMALELMSEAESGREQCAEVELIFFLPDRLIGQSWIWMRPFGFRPDILFTVSRQWIEWAARDRCFWVRAVDEGEGALVRPMEPGRVALLSPLDRLNLQPTVDIAVRLSRAATGEEVATCEDDVTGFLRFQLGEFTEASPEDVERVRAAEGGEERRLLLDELSAEAFANAPHRYPIQSITGGLKLSREPILRLCPPDSLRLAADGEGGYLLLRNASPRYSLAWCVRQPSPAALELEAEEGVLGPGSKGHLRLSALARGPAAAVSLTFLFARCSQPPDLNQLRDPASFVRQEPPESIAQLLLNVLLPID